MSLNRRRFVGISGATLAALGLPVGRAGAQGGQPLDTVKLITGFPPGCTSDTLCRRVAENLRGGTYTKSALVENKPGAGGQIAVQSMKGAPTDGSVILQTPASMLMRRRFQSACPAGCCGPSAAQPGASRTSVAMPTSTYSNS